MGGDVAVIIRGPCVHMSSSIGAIRPAVMAVTRPQHTSNDWCWKG